MLGLLVELVVEGRARAQVRWDGHALRRLPASWLWAASSPPRVLGCCHITGVPSVHRVRTKCPTPDPTDLFGRRRGPGADPARETELPESGELCSPRVTGRLSDQTPARDTDQFSAPTSFALCGRYRLPPRISDLRGRLAVPAGVEVLARGGHLVIRALTPVPGLYRGLPLHPDEEDDPYVFRLDLSELGMSSVRVVFGRDAAGGAAAIHADRPRGTDADKATAAERTRTYLAAAMSLARCPRPTEVGVSAADQPRGRPRRSARRMSPSWRAAQGIVRPASQILRCRR